ncbi:MAG: TRAP transporter TAXI family solute receptor [Candidatus Marinamargulisbacteria bacterium]|jgi:TRAP transporter TAXI family solute receptor
MFVTIGTGGITGVYYPTGGAITRMVNKKLDEYNIKATVESTAGSVYNINAVLRRNLDFGISQSDRQYQAYNGLAEWDEIGPQKDLRSVFSIHPESITLIASAKSSIGSVKDLKGKRVNIGNPGSGQIQNTKDILWAFRVSQLDVKDEQVKAIEAPNLLQDERIDAFFYTVGHPNGNIKEATSGRVKVRFVPITGRQIEPFLKKHPYYTRSIIPISFYPNAENKNDVQTVGVKATLITTKLLSEKVVYAITKEVFENFETFKTLHQAYSRLTKEKMLQGLTAPIHVGALKYYQESGLLKHIDDRLLPDEWKK